MKNKIFKTDCVDLFQLPRDVILGETVMEISGNRRCLIENYDSIVEYSTSCLTIKGKHKYVIIKGTGMTIDTYSKSDLLIKGDVHEIIFE